MRPIGSHYGPSSLAPSRAGRIVCTVFATTTALSAPFAVSAGGYDQPTYYGQSSYYTQSTYQLDFTKNSSVTGNISILGAVSKGSGTFVIDHPLDPENKLLYHSFVESPDVKNLYDGVATLDDDGEATVELPEYFEALNTGFRYQFFPHFEPMPDLYVKQGVIGNRFVIAGGKPGGEISWQVTGIRHDPYILANPVVNEVEKSTSTEAKRGECLHEPLCE